MIKKLRNKMLMMNMISTFCLIVIAFSAIYAVTYNNIESKIEQSLYRTFSFHRPVRWHHQANSYKTQEQPPESAVDKGKAENKEKTAQNGANQQSYNRERELRDFRNFSVFVDSDGNVHTDSMLGQNSEHYETVANAALAQHTDEGEFISEGVVWRFVSHKFKNDSKIIALVDISAEKSLLRQLVITFSVGTLVLLVLIFLISLHFANRAIKPLTEAWDKQKQFVADASHELKTPLAAINTNIDVLLSKSGNTIADEEKWLRYIKSEVQRLSELSGNLLLMAKIDAELQVKKTTASISEIVESTILNLEAVAYEKGVQLDYDIEKEITGKIEVSQITRLCLILLDNAIKYSPKNEYVKIRLVRCSRDQVMLTVHNMGEAIPEEDIEKIFDRFYRVDKSRSTTGYGLGLAMAKEIVQMHNGKISVKSSEKDGTEFSVTLLCEK